MVIAARFISKLPRAVNSRIERWDAASGVHDDS